MFKWTSLKIAAIWRNTVRVSVICVGVAMYRHVWLQCTVHLVTSNTRVTRACLKGPWVEGLWNRPTLLNSKELGRCQVAVFNGHWEFHLFHVTNECHNNYHTKATQITRKKKQLIMYSTSGSYINCFKLNADNFCWQSLEYVLVADISFSCWFENTATRGHTAATRCPSRFQKSSMKLCQ